MDYRDLQNLGLSEKEAKVYLASLELGAAAVQDISKQAGVNRATTYVMIESLMEKGLASSFAKGKKRFFSVESPEQLSNILRLQEQEIKRKEEDLEKLLPGLKSLFDTAGERPVVRFFEGKEGLKAIQRDIFKTKYKTMEEVVSLDESYRVFPQRVNDHRQKLKDKNKKNRTDVRVIYTSKKGVVLSEREGGIRRRFVPPNKFNFTTEIYIYKNNAAFVSLKGKIMGVIIEGQEIANNLRYVFDLAWEGSALYQK